MLASIDSFVGVYEGAFSDDFCDSVIGEFEKAAKYGFTKTRQELNDGGTSVKNDSAIWSGNLYNEQMGLKGINDLIGVEFNEVFWGKCYKHYAEYFDALNNSGAHHIWGNKVQKTNVGQGYHIWHYESSSRASCHRLLSHIIYLNDVEEGGETELLYFSKRFKPKKGTMILFPAAFTHTHRGNPPISNEKYIITGWTEF